MLHIGGICLKSHHLKETYIVKESIYLALMELMKDNDYESITITQITKKAGVSRMAYYRHYTSKDEIFDDYLEDLFIRYQANVLEHRNNLFHATKAFFSFFRMHKVLLVNLNKANLTLRLLDRFDTYIKLLLKELDIIQDKSLKIEPHKIDFITGGMFNLLMTFLKNDMKDSDTDLGKIALMMIQPILN